MQLTWKWRMDPWKTLFHYKQVVFHFHVSSRESRFMRCPAYFTEWDTSSILVNPPERFHLNDFNRLRLNKAHFWPSLNP